MIYDNIKVLCEEQGLTVMALEQKAGLSNGTIGRWRTYNPGAIYLKKVADALGVTVDRLLEGVETNGKEA